MKLGIKRKILLVVIGLLALTSGLEALLASYFTNRQNEQTAFADLERDLITWQNDLQDETIRLRSVALGAVGDAVFLDQLAELVTLEINLAERRRGPQFSETARTLAYMKSVSINRLHLVLRTGGYTGIAVYTGGGLSHLITASAAGMAVHKGDDRRAWVQAAANAQGDLPLQSWPAWSEAAPPAAPFRPPVTLEQPSVSFHFQSAPQRTLVQFAVPVQGVRDAATTDAATEPTFRFVSELKIAGLASPQGARGAAPEREAATVAVIAFQKLIDRAALERVAAKTGKLPTLFSPDGAHAQQLAQGIATESDLLRDAQAAAQSSAYRVLQRTVRNSQGSYYQALLPWRFEGGTRLILGLTSSRASTLENIRQTVAAILIVAGLVLLVSIGAGMFWIGRFIDPIVALTTAAKKMETQRRPQPDAAHDDEASTQELQRIATEAPDEVGDLARAFNAMIGELRQAFETLEQHVQERTAELRQQTRYLRTLIDTLPLLAWLKDTKSRYLAANQATAEACGRTVEDIAGRTDLELWPRELADAYRADDAEVMTTRQRKTVEERLADVKGTVWIETYKAPVVDEDGTVLGTVGAARNISERKAVEGAREAALAEAERLARLRSEFLAQMSHELRTPLNAILGYAQILQRDEGLSARQARGLATIQESGHHLLTLINDILDLSRIGASKLELLPTDVHLPTFLRVVADIIRVKADEKNLLFTYEGGADLPGAVRVDDRRLRQVLLNLLGNAVKFTDEGRIILRVRRIGRTPAEPGSGNVRLCFEVEDTGIGMTSAQTRRLFSPFEQVADADRRQGGAGLGLAISRQLVRLMGGDIQVQSERGRGSTFRFELELPLAQSAAEAPPSPRQITGYAGRRREVLIVDDVMQSRSMLMDLLTALGFDVVEATNGEEAIAQVRRRRPHLIVMDITMPVMDGLEATRRIRATPEPVHLPIIIASASATTEDESRSRAAGADAFIRKPIEQEDLLKALGEQLEIEWTYSEALAEPAPSLEEAREEMQIPPAEEMLLLHRLALAGDMRALRRRAEHLERLDPRYRPFARRLGAMAQRYQSQAILAFVEQRLPPPNEHDFSA
jgi:PAS domain S-box-containing protein